MKKPLLGVIVFVCCFANTAISQQSSASPIAPSIILDIKIIDVSARTIEEIERLSQDKNRVNQLVAEGKIKVAANVQMRASSGESDILRLGQRVPIVRADSSGSKVDFDNTGLYIETLPTLTRDNLIDVRLKIELTVISRAKNPVYIQRSISQVVKVKPAETSLLMGFTQNEPLWASMDDPPQGNFFVLLTARLTN
jgi:hypothetical protein